MSRNYVIFAANWLSALCVFSAIVDAPGGARVTPHTPTSKLITTRWAPSHKKKVLTPVQSVALIYPVFSPLQKIRATTNDFTIDTTATDFTDQMLSQCANNCFAGGTSFSTVPYYTLNTPNNVKLVYTEEREHPRPVISADVTLMSGSNVPAYYVFSATLNGTRVKFLTGDTLVYFYGDSATVRLASQFDASSYSTGLYNLVVTVQAFYYFEPTVTHSYSRPLAIVNEAHSPLGRGWTVAGVQHLYISGGSYLITDGTGSAVYFPDVGITAADFSALNYYSDGHYYIRSYYNGTHVYFTAEGQDTLLVDRFGFRTRYSYNGTQLVSISDPERYIRGNTGTYLSFSYGSYGLSSISEVGGTANRTTNVTVASDSTLQTVTDPDGVTTHYAYDSLGRLSTVTDRRGGLTTYKYDTHSWKLTELDLPQVAVDVGGGSTANVIPKIKYTPWQTLGVPTFATTYSVYHLGGATPVLRSNIYATIIDPLGRVTTMTVDRWGQPLVITDPASRVTTITRKGLLAVKVVLPTSGIDTIDYVSGTPLPKYIQTAGDSIVHYKYGAQNQVDSVWGPGLTSEYRFLEATSGRVDSIRYAGTSTQTARYTYDSYNRMLTVLDPNGHTLNYHYSSTDGNTDSISGSGNIYAVNRFDAFGRDTATRASGSVVWERTVYDTLNRIRKVWHTGIANDTVIITYDSLYPIRVRQSGGQVYKFAINALGWTEKRYDSQDTTHWISYRYDSAGRMTSFTNRRGQRVDLTYDLLDHLTSRTINGSLTDHFGYSTNGRVINAWRDNVSRDTIYYGLNGQTDSIVRDIAGHRYAITYAYASRENGARRTVVIKNDAGINFSNETDVAYNGTTPVDSLVLTGGKPDTMVTHYTPDGFRDSVRIPAQGRTDVFVWSARHKLYAEAPINPNHTNFADTLVRRMQYDSLGRIVEDYGLIGAELGHYDNRSFAYDSLRQLLLVRSKVDSACTQIVDSLIIGIQWTCTNLSSVTQDSADYDASGNRLFLGASYSTMGNRLLEGPVGYTYTYDADGNMVSRTHGGVTDSLFWSATGLLDSVASGGASGLRHRYEYNSFGQLVRRQTAMGGGGYAVDRYFVWDQTNMIAELPYPGTSRIAQYVYSGGLDQPYALATDSAGTSKIRHYWQERAEGDVTGVLQGVSTFHQYTRYSPWGEIRARPINVLSDTNRLGWKGLMYEGDSTKLYYVRNRWYDPQVGRFVSEDPLGLAGGMNFYTFGNNDPVNNSDPFGLNETGIRITGIRRYCVKVRVLLFFTVQTCYSSRPSIRRVSPTDSTAQGNGIQGSAEAEISDFASCLRRVNWRILAVCTLALWDPGSNGPIDRSRLVPDILDPAEWVAKARRSFVVEPEPPESDHFEGILRFYQTSSRKTLDWIHEQSLPFGMLSPAMGALPWFEMAP